MNKHSCDRIIITCIDFRLQEFIDKWIDKEFEPESFDRVALAGGINDAFAILKQVEISKRLHNISEVILVNHEDCGAYGPEGTYQRHVSDLQEAQKKIGQLFGLPVKAYYLHLNGEFEKVSSAPN